jgi:hypothetical protein
MEKNVVKFGAGVIGLVAVSAAVFYGVNWYQERNSPEYAVNLEYQKLLEAYKNDSYGGATPEETLQLFIDALKAGDTELAAKYFIIEEQEGWKEKLKNLQEKKLLVSMIFDLERKNYKSELDDGRIFFEIANDNNEVALTIDIGRGPNGKWKIIDL